MNLTQALLKNKEAIGRVLEIDYRTLPFFVFDLTSNNNELSRINMSNPKEFSKYINKKLRKKSAGFGIGRYNENRVIYAHSSLFEETAEKNAATNVITRSARTIHLGIDLWCKAETKVLCPIKGTIRSFRNNIGEGDYGPTIILEHEIDGIRFFTLYGHLSLGSIRNVYVGQEFNKEDVIGNIGNFPANGNWPPHLHFQIITNMHEKEGDYPGVCSSADREKFLELCPDPNLILQITL